MTSSNSISFYTILLVLNLLACSEERQNSITYRPLNLHEQGTYSFYLRDIIPNKPYVQVVSDGEEEFLYVNNTYQNGITRFNLATGKEDTTILFPRQGPDVIRNMQGFYVHTPDSIFISSTTYQLFLYHTPTGTTKRFPLNHPKQGAASLGMLTTFRHGYFDGQTISMVGIPYQKPIQRGFLNIDVDLISGMVQENYTYPEALKKHSWSLVQWIGVYRTRTPEGKWLYSFTQSDDLYLTDHNKKGVKIPAPTHLGPSPRPLPPKLAAIDRKGEQYQQMTTSYYGILYDPYRAVYYRLVTHPVPGITEDNLHRFHFNDKPISVIVLDRSLAVIGEYMLPRNTYFAIGFVSKKGLCLLLENENNEAFGSEEYLDCQCMTFSVAE